MGPKAVALVEGIIDWIEDRPLGTGRPPMPTLRVVEALRFFVREACSGGNCGPPLARRVAPPYAVAWTSGAARLCCAGCISP